MAESSYHHGHLKVALIEAAEQVVLEHGVGALALRDLARSIGVSPSAVYRHFPSREHLVSAVAQRAREELARSLLAARDTVANTGTKASRSTRRLSAIGHAYVRFAVENPRAFEAAFTPCDVPPVDEHPNAWEVLVEAVDEMAATGVMPKSRRNEAPLIAWAAVHGLSTIITASSRPSQPGLHQSTADHMIDTVVDGIIRALR